MAYRAQIEIGVKGVQELTQLQKRLEGTAYKIDEINKKQASVFGGLAQSIKNYTRQLNMAEEALFNVAAGTAQETRAVRNYVDALGNANAIRARQLGLIRDEIELKRQAALASKGIRETTQYAGPIGPGQASSILGGQSMPVGGRIQRTLDARKDELRLQEALLRLEEKSATETNKKVQLQEELLAGTQKVFNLLQRQAGLSQYAQPLPIPGGLRTEQILAIQAAKRTENLAIEQRLQRTAAATVTEYNLQLGILRQMAEIGKRINDSTQQELVNQRRLNRVLRVRQGREFQRRRREATGSAIIGGAFPLLFGQGVGASLGGGLGGAAGGALGGQFGFGLSLVGTAIGQTVDTLSTELNKLAESLKTPSEALATLEEAGIKVAESSKRQIKQLEEAGRVYDAQTVLFAEITARLGTNAVNQLNALNDASEDLQNEFSALKGQILSDLLPAVVLATRAFADIVAILNNLQIPKSLLDLATGTVAGTLLPGVLPPGLLGAGIREATGALVPGTPPDRSDALDQQNRLNRATQNRIDLLNQERQLLSLSDNLLDDAIYKAREQAIDTAWRVKEQNLILEGKGTEEEITKLILERDRELKKLADDRTKAQERLNKQRKRELESAAKEQQRAAEAAQRQAEAIAKGRLESEQLLERLNMQLAIEQEINPIKKIQLQNALEQLEIQQRYGNLIAAEEDAIRRANLERAGGLELQIANIRQTQDLIDKITEAGRAMGEFLAEQIDPTPFEKMRQNITQLKESLRELVDPVNQITNAATAIGDAFSQSFVNAISGAKTAKEALADFFKSVADYFLDMAKQIIAKMIQIAILNNVVRIFGGGLTTSSGVSMSAGQATQSGFNMGSGLAAMLPGRANGGPVTGGSPYIVGERGPELFVPRSSGTIIPNDKMGGGVTVGSINISVENSGDSLSPAAQKQIAGQVQGIVLSTLANERRSGGML